MLCKAVIENFCGLYDAGLLYRDNRLVNWCVALNTTLSNLEVSPINDIRSLIESNFLR